MAANLLEGRQVAEGVRLLASGRYRVEGRRVIEETS